MFFLIKFLLTAKQPCHLPAPGSGLVVPSLWGPCTCSRVDLLQAGEVTTGALTIDADPAPAAALQSRVLFGIQAVSEDQHYGSQAELPIPF